MRSWVPVPGTTKDRLVNSALALFGARDYDSVTVHDIAADAGVTTGPLYHHFGGKAQLYSLVRTDVERRVADRVAGVLEVHEPRNSALQPALLVGFDWLIRSGYARLIGEQPPPEHAAPDEIMQVVSEKAGDPLALLALAAWRSALTAAAARPHHAAALRDALARLLLVDD